VRHASVGILILLVLGLTAGCGGGGMYKTAAVKGHVTCDGKPVSGGTITFSPVAGDAEKGANPGKAASGSVDASGNFVLSTYANDDGAVVGKHKVVYASGADPSSKEPVCKAPADLVKEVVAGDNEFTIELSTAKK